MIRFGFSMNFPIIRTQSWWKIFVPYCFYVTSIKSHSEWQQNTAKTSVMHCTIKIRSFFCVCLSLNVRLSVSSKELGRVTLIICYALMLSSFPLFPAYCTSHMAFSFRAPSSITTGLHIKQNSSCNFSWTISSLCGQPPILPLLPEVPCVLLLGAVVWCEGEPQTRSDT